MKKLIALILTFTIVAAVSVTAFASFPDLRDEKWDWARDEINEMTSEGIIAGYTDGNFGPADGVTKLQSLLLMSRIIGYNNDDMAPVIKVAEEKYEDVLADVNQRDYQDSHREIAPLKPSEDSIMLDTSTLNLDESIQLVIKTIKENI